jgi:predicted transcriptional regulator
VFHAQATGTAGSLAIGLPEGVLERLLTECRGDLREGLATDGLSARMLSDPLPFGLVVTGDGEEGAVAVTLHDGGTPSAILVNDDSTAVSWGRRLFQRRWDGGSPLALGTGDGPNA